jgi:hypothetical protein
MTVESSRWELLDAFDVPDKYVLDKLGVERQYYATIAIPGVVKSRFIPYCVLSETYLSETLCSPKDLEELKTAPIHTVPHIRIEGGKKYPMLAESEMHRVLFPAGDAYLLYTYFPEAPIIP